MKSLVYRFAVLSVITSLLLSAAPPPPSVNHISEHPATSSARQRDFGKLPVYFVENRGQMDDRVAYYIQGSDKTIYFTPEGVTFALTVPLRRAVTRPRQFMRDPELFQARLKGRAPEPPPLKRWVVKLDFVGANPNVRPMGQDRTEAVISYFKGRPEEWHTGLPTYARIVYPELWPGIDLVYYGTVNELKYEFVVKPGADPGRIRLAYHGAEARLNAEGEMEVSTPLGGFTDAKPVAYQTVHGTRRPVTADYAPDIWAGWHGRTEYGFQVGTYDPTQPLILDPTILVYSGYIGGSGDDAGHGIAVDSAGNAYVTGVTQSTETTFPVASGPDLTHNGGYYDTFVAKVKADGTGLDYAGYIGGGMDDYGGQGHGIAVDGAGNAYIQGWTLSDETTFPVVGGPDLTFNDDDNSSLGDAFVAKVNADGTGLAYAGYIGGSRDDYGYGIAVDGAGNAYVTGWTASDETTFPVRGGPDLTFNGEGDVYVAKVKADGTGLVYAGYIGGSGGETGSGIAVDNAGNTYIMGYTLSGEVTFPVVSGPDLAYNGGYNDAFVAKVKADGTGLVYAGYIGGSSYDYGTGIAVDSTGNAYVTGYTQSTEMTFPVGGGPDLTYNGGYYDAFVAKVKADGTGLDYAGYIGGSGMDSGQGIAVDSTGNIYVTGQIDSTEATFPAVGGPDLTYNGSTDAFVAKVNATGTGLVYAGYIGGSGMDYGTGIAVDSMGNIYVTGATASNEATFPVRGGPDLTYNGGSLPYGDAFIAKVGEVAPTTYSISGQVITSNNTPVSGVTLSDGAGHTVATNASGGYTITNLVPGAYTLTPSKSGYTFSPVTRTVTVPPDATGENFVAQQVYEISGRILDANQNPVPNIALSTNPGAQATTNVGGYYTFTGVISGAYTITPILNGYVFTPTTRTVSVPPNRTGQNFSARRAYAISGQVVDHSGVPLARVIISTSTGISATTNANGIYTATGLIAGTYIVVPIKNGYGFTPISRTVLITTANMVGEDFEGIAESTGTGQIELEGLEVTQAIQNYSRTVVLIQDKATFVRAHVRSSSGNMNNVIAELVGTRGDGSALPGSPLQPSNLGGSIKVIENPDRGQLYDSFFFELPASWRSGTVNLEFRGVNKVIACPARSYTNNVCKLTVTFQQTPPLDMRLVGVIWKDNNGVYHTPTLTDLQELVNEIKALYPISDLHWDYTYSLLFDPTWNILESGASASYDYKRLHFALAGAGIFDGCSDDCQRVYVGVMVDKPQGIGVMGEASLLLNNVTAGFWDEDFKFVFPHEIAHTLGRYHTSYPKDDNSYPYPSGYISPEDSGDKAFYGFHISTKEIYGPTTRDLMCGNCSHAWPSDYTYEALHDEIIKRFGPSGVALRMPKGASSPALLISGFITPTQEIGYIDSVYEFNTSTAISITASGSYTLRLEDADNNVLADYPFELDSGVECPTVCSENNQTGIFALVVPSNSQTSRISLLHRPTVLYSKTASANPPQVNVVYPNGGEVLSGTSTTLSWSASDLDGDNLKYVIQYSSDGGTTWQTLATSWVSTTYKLDLSAIAGTAQGMLRVLASDGFHTTQDQSNGTFQVAKHAPQVIIQRPENNSLYIGNQTMILEGQAFDNEDDRLTDAAFSWSSSLNGNLGSGRSLALGASALTEGTQTITLTVRDSDGQTNTSTLLVQIYRERPTLPTQLSVAPGTLSFDTSVVNSATISQSLSIRNIGDGAVAWTAQTDQSWLQLSSISGTAPINLLITIPPSGLPVGDYTGNITITMPSALNSPFVVPVILNIAPSYRIHLPLISR